MEQELRKLVEEFLALNERKKAGVATPRELARWTELHAKVTSRPPTPRPDGGKR